MLNESAGDAIAFTLLISEKGGAERRQSFKGAEATIGRVPGNDIVLPKGNVSKRHARILFREGRLIVTDLNSTNGTFVNRRRITQATILREEDRLFIGDYVLRVEGIGPASDSVPTDTTDRLSAPAGVQPRPLSAPESEALIVPVPAPSDRAIPDELARTTASVSPPPRLAEVVEPSRPSQRGNESAALQNEAVIQVIDAVTKALGEPPLEADEEAERAFVDAIAAAVDHRLVDGEVPVGVSADAIIEQVRAELLDLGPIRAFLGDANVTVLGGTRFDDLVEIRDGKTQGALRAFSSAASLRRALERLIAAESGSRRGLPSHVVETFPSGLSLSVAAPDVGAEAGTLFVLRKASREPNTLDELVKRGVLSRAMATFLQLSVAARLNVLVTSPPEEGANLLLEALLGAMPRERLLVAGNPSFAPEVLSSLSVIARREEESLGPSLPVGLSVPGSRPVLVLPSPTRLVEFFEMNPTPHGSTVSLTASSARAAVRNIPAAMVAARPGLPLEVAIRWLEGSFDLVVELGRLRDGRVRVLRIAEWDEGGLELEDVFSFAAVRGSSGGGIEGSFVASGEAPRLVERIQATGIRLDPGLFQRSAPAVR